MATGLANKCFAINIYLKSSDVWPFHELKKYCKPKAVFINSSDNSFMPEVEIRTTWEEMHKAF